MQWICSQITNVVHLFGSSNGIGEVDLIRRLKLGAHLLGHSCGAKVSGISSQVAGAFRERERLKICQHMTQYFLSVNSDFDCPANRAVRDASHLQADRVDQDQQNAANIEGDADKQSGDVETLVRRCPELGEIQETKTSIAPVGQGRVFGEGIPFKLGLVDDGVYHCSDYGRGSNDKSPLFRLGAVRTRAESCRYRDEPDNLDPQERRPCVRAMRKGARPEEWCMSSI